MKHAIFLCCALSTIGLIACHNTSPIDTIKDPEGTIYYTESNELIANPERGLYKQTYYKASDLDLTQSASAVEKARTGKEKTTLYLHSYYMTDYIESDIAPEFLERLQKNMDALREGGGKVILRFSYKSSEKASAKPWDATPEWASKHIEQLKPYLQENADVILCLQAGFIGVWGEWYYTTGFPRNPSKSEEWAPRWELINHLLEVLPENRQLAVRTPQYKRRYLQDMGITETPLSEAEAYQNTAKARIGGHNDCFVSSSSDVGTYRGESDREFWAEDTKYTFMGGETCACVEKYSNGERAISEMEKYHWTYLCNSYHPDVLSSWQKDGSFETIQRRLGYRLVLDKAFPTQDPKAGERFSVVLTLRNVGFAAPINPRDVEMILISETDPEQQFVFKQDIDPRYWMAGDTIVTTLHAKLDAAMAGNYKVYVNLPDPMPNLHDRPEYAIRLANKDLWDDQRGYNYLLTITL